MYNVGVIGLGMGRNHVKGFNNHPESRVVAISDLDEARLAEIGDQHDVPGRYTSVEAMLEREDLDIVSIATPNKFHKPLTLAALDAGCHVLCEKPMAMNAAEGEEMRDAAKAAGKRLMINFSYRFTPVSQQLKREVEAGFLGDIYFARTMWMRRKGMPKFGGWFGQKALAGGGPLIDLGVHRLDLALWLMEYPEPEWVLARTYDPIAKAEAAKVDATYDVEDLAAAMITFKNGASLELTASWAGHIAEPELMETRLLGTEGGLVQRNTDGRYAFESELYFERNGSQFTTRPSGKPPEARSAMEHFVDAIVADEPHPASADEGVLVMKLLDAVYESAARREPVRVS